MKSSYKETMSNLSVRAVFNNNGSCYHSSLRCREKQGYS
jgi:hypothetical protein